MPTTSLAGWKLRTDPDSLLALSAILVFLGALGTILLALAFEHIGGLKPCPLCYQQRWAYYAAIPLAGLAALCALYEYRDVAVLALSLVAAAFLINAAFGVYHAGVEWHWWPGPADCAGGELARPGNLLQSLSQTRVIRCDEAAWRFLGISFAGYNAIISFGLGMIALAASWYATRESTNA
ncbi:MAG: disulfide bond formation protein B [Alphaproteobacteria bacterium]|nr:MAG: disulfide bond formation protein B [Alphaproteobacteria bacterium]